MKALLLTPLLLVAACDGREESAIDNLANGANVAQVENSFRAEAMAVMEPLDPPAPGTPGGLPIDPAPLAEGSIDPDSAQGAAQVVQGYYGLLEEKRFEDAQALWNPRGQIGTQDDAHFAARFRGFSEIHANVGAPSEPEGGLALCHRASPALWPDRRERQTLLRLAPGDLAPRQRRARIDRRTAALAYRTDR